MIINDLEEIAVQISQYMAIVVFYEKRKECDNCTNNETSDFKAFSNATNAFPDLPFFYTNNKSIPNNFNQLSNTSQIIILKNFDEGFSVFNKEFNSASIVKFIRSYSYPLLNIYTQDNFIRIINNRISFSALFMNNTNENEALKSNYYEALNSIRDAGLYNIFGNYSDQSQTTLSIDYELNATQLPFIIIFHFDTVNNKDIIVKRYKTELKDIESKEGVMSFMQRWQNSKV